MITHLEYGNDKVHYYSEEEKVALSKQKMLAKYKQLLTSKAGPIPSIPDIALECLFQTIIESVQEDMESIKSNYPGSELFDSLGKPVSGSITKGKINPGGFR